MIFETLNESNERGELLLVAGGMCHWHLRRDGQLTIREIIVEKGRQRRGIGRRMLEYLILDNPDAVNIFAKCPWDLPANNWYQRMGFTLEGTETTRNGRTLNLWRLPIQRVCPTCDGEGTIRIPGTEAETELCPDCIAADLCPTCGAAMTFEDDGRGRCAAGHEWGG